MESFKSRIALLLEVDHVENSDELEAFEWFDSLTILSIIALVEEEYKIALSAEDIKKSRTIGGLLGMINSRINVN